MGTLSGSPNPPAMDFVGRSPTPSTRGCSVARLAAAAALALATSALVGCRSGAQAGDRPIATVTVGQAGGRLASANGQLEVTVPAGAVAAEVALTVQQIDAPRAGAVGQVFEIGPTGMTFGRPVLLAFHYRAEELGGSAPDALRVATLAYGGWQTVPSLVDPTAGLVSAQVAHLSPWTLVIGRDGPGGGADGAAPDAQPGVGAVDGGAGGGGEAGSGATAAAP